MPRDSKAQAPVISSDFLAGEQAAIDARQSEINKGFENLRETASKVSPGPMPEAPIEESTTPAPSRALTPQAKSAINDWALLSLGMVMLGHGSAGAANAATHALAGAVQGLNEGNEIRFRDEFTQWQKEVENVNAKNRDAFAKYKAVLKSRSISFNEKMKEFEVIATELGHEQLALDAHQRHVDAISSKLQVMQTAAERFKLQSVVAVKQLEVAQKQLQALKGGGANTFTPDALSAMAEMVSRGVPFSVAVPGWGTLGAQQRAIVMNAATGKMRSTGMTPEAIGTHLAQAQLRYKSSAGAMTLLNKLQAANRGIIGQLDWNADQAYKEMKKLGRSDISPALNAIANGVQYWVGNPEVNPMQYYLQGAAMEAARLQSGAGASIQQLHEGAMEQAKKWSSAAQTPAQWKRLAESMHAEGETRLRVYGYAMQSALSEATAPSEGEQQAAGPAAPSSSSQNAIQGDNVDDLVNKYLQ
ncbi:MAG: hypothetical protein ACRD52_00670 [Candidatus Acidiferrales bacterium]